MPLVGYDSLCDDHASTIVSKDRKNPQKHIANNVDHSLVSQYQIDGVVIKDNSTRCDFLVLNDDKKDAYLIELKGSDVSKACMQLEATYETMKDVLSGYKVHFRVVYNRCNTHEIRTPQYNRFLKKYNKVFDKATKVLEEDI